MKIQNKIVCAIWFTAETKTINGHYQLECFLKVNNDNSNGDKNEFNALKNIVTLQLIS